MKLRVLNPWSATISSALLLGGLGIGAWLAFHKLADHFLFYAAITLLILSSGSLMILVLGIIFLKASSRHETSGLLKREEECGRAFEWDSGAILPRASLLVLRPADWSLPRLERLTDGRLLARRRGVFREFDLRLAATDLLGMVKVRLLLSGPADLVILPADVVGPGSILDDQRLSGDAEDARTGAPEGDLLDTEQHQRGQSFRHFMWKAYFRSGGRVRLVRKPEAAASSSRVFFFLPGEDDETGASLVRLLIEGQIAGDNWWLFVPGSGKLLGSADREEAMLSLAESGNWHGDLIAEIKKFGAMASGNFAAAQGVFIITSQPHGECVNWANSLRLAVHELSGFSPSIIVAINKGQHFAPQSFDGEFGGARPVEIEMPPDLVFQA